MDATALKTTLELTILSLDKELHLDWNHAAESLYVVVRAESITCYATGPATEGRVGGGNPQWNHKLVVEVPVHARSITLEVKCKNKPDVGMARIAISDFLGCGGAVADQCLQFLSYSLRDWHGRRSGVIHFSVRVRAPEKPFTCSQDVVIGFPVSWNN